MYDGIRSLYRHTRGANDEEGLFIAEENDTPQMIEKYLVKTGLWEKGDNMAKRLID